LLVVIVSPGRVPVDNISGSGSRRISQVSIEDTKLFSQGFNVLFVNHQKSWHLHPKYLDLSNLTVAAMTEFISQRSPLSGRVAGRGSRVTEVVWGSFART
jgi:hypothetical protein